MPSLPSPEISYHFGFPRPGIPTFVGISYRFPTDVGSNSQTSDSNSRERANPTDFLPCFARSAKSQNIALVIISAEISKIRIQ